MIQCCSSLVSLVHFLFAETQVSSVVYSPIEALQFD